MCKILNDILKETEGVYANTLIYDNLKSLRYKLNKLYIVNI